MTRTLPVDIDDDVDTDRDDRTWRKRRDDVLLVWVVFFTGAWAPLSRFEPTVARVLVQRAIWCATKVDIKV